jgi:hypothetical protein
MSEEETFSNLLQHTLSYLHFRQVSSNYVSYRILGYLRLSELTSAEIELPQNYLELFQSNTFTSTYTIYLRKFNIKKTTPSYLGVLQIVSMMLSYRNVITINQCTPLLLNLT